LRGLDGRIDNLNVPVGLQPFAGDAGHIGAELDTATWKRVFTQAAGLGVLQVHFSGGEPLVRRDLVDLVRHANEIGLYGNLITSGIHLDAARLKELVEAGLEHVQLSFQDADTLSGDRIAGLAGSQVAKRRVARLVREAGVPLTVNAVVHRQNLDRLGEIIELAVALGADRLEVAHVQYYGWALHNRAALLPSRVQLDAATATVEAARARLAGIMVIDYVVPDYYAHRPKACMGGWGRQFFNISPAGKVLPCHAAESITGLEFESVRSNHSIAWIWQNSDAFNRYRGTGWMKEPCKSCEFREIDFGGCRCQAFALTGNAHATDPVCHLSPHHHVVEEQAEIRDDAEYVYRRL